MIETTLNQQSGQGAPAEMYVNHSVGESDTDGVYVSLESNHHGSQKTSGKNEPKNHGLFHELMPNWLSW